MRLIISSSENFSSLIQDLEQKIADQYFVYPVKSNKATERFRLDDKSVKTLSHYVFGYRSKGRITDFKLVYYLVKLLWNDVSKAWNPGSLVMWRRSLEIKEENNKDAWFDRGKNAPDENDLDNWEIQVTIRIGSFDSPRVKIKEEGKQLPYIDITK
jgi:hypothetical protein